ncbi:hypothetical protein [Sorangium sp. So ce388]|uniref:hypothetical protein n=1 Tax=Sorangium sp. So ce388 TaxID=3133309 RepID=UPI003F5C9D6D
MRWISKAFAQGSMAVTLALALPACDQGERQGDAAGTTGVIRAALEVGGARHDVTAIHYKVVDAGSTCGDAPIAETTSLLEDEALPGSVLPAGSGAHAGADGLFVLPAGSYRVCASPMSEGAPSAECAPTEGVAYVAAEVTTEIQLVSQCAGGANGGLDTVVALNDPPRVTDLDIAPSKFITQCETATIKVSAEDPDGDQITFGWSITASPAGSSPVLQATDATGSFSTDTPGDYQVHVTISDVLGGSSGLSFPIHVSAGDCGCACPAGFTQLADGGCARVYEVTEDLLINQDASCDDTGDNRYNGCNGEPYGFQWTDLGGALGPVRQVDIALENGITCSPGDRPVSLNGAAIGSFSAVDSCACFPTHAPVSLPDVDIGPYVQGDANSVTIPGPSCDGLSRSDALGGGFARVTVTYDCGGGSTCLPPETACVGPGGDTVCVDLSSDEANCGGCGDVCSGRCVAGVCTDGGADRVLVAGAPGDPSWNYDVQAQLNGTGAFSAVDVFNIQEATPTLADLQAYDAVLVYSDYAPFDAATLGDNLATYHDGGGRVVVATFANASHPLGGRWANEGYHLIEPAGQDQPNETGPLGINEPGSALLTGVTSLGADSAYRSIGGPVNGGIVVATWGSGAPLIVRGVKNGRARADLNMFPPSRAARSDFWYGSGAEIMRNALLFR